MFATLLVILQQPGLGIGQRSVDRSFHRVGADHPVRNADETLGRETDQTPRQQQFVTGTAAAEDLLESKVRSDRSPLGQVGQKTVPAKQPPANDGEPAKIRLPIGMQNLQAGRNFRSPEKLSGTLVISPQANGICRQTSGFSTKNPSRNSKSTPKRNGFPCAAQRFTAFRTS